MVTHGSRPDPSGLVSFVYFLLCLSVHARFNLFIMDKSRCPVFIRGQWQIAILYPYPDTIETKTEDAKVRIPERVKNKIRCYLWSTFDRKR